MTARGSGSVLSVEQAYSISQPGKTEDCVEASMSYRFGNKKALFSGRGGTYVAAVAPKVSLRDKIETGDMVATIDYSQEWPEIFDEVWRAFRDGYYLENMHGRVNARIDPVTGKVQYAKQGSPSSAWTDVDFEASIQESAPQGRLVLEYAPSALIEDPQYYSHFSISKIVDGSTHLLSFDAIPELWTCLKNFLKSVLLL